MGQPSSASLLRVESDLELNNEKATPQRQQRTDKDRKVG